MDEEERKRREQQKQAKEQVNKLNSMCLCERGRVRISDFTQQFKNAGQSLVLFPFGLLWLAESGFLNST